LMQLGLFIISKHSTSKRSNKDGLWWRFAIWPNVYVSEIWVFLIFFYSSQFRVRWS
jgi:hypothetical protein